MICNSCINPEPDHCLNCRMCNPKLQCKQCDFTADPKTMTMAAHEIETGHIVDQIRNCPRCKGFLLIDHNTVNYKHHCGFIFYIKNGIISVLGQKLSRKSKYRQKKYLEKLGSLETPETTIAMDESS